MIHTYQDSIDHLIDFVGGGPADQVLRDVRRSVAEAYRELPNAHKWPYLVRQGRIITNPPYFGIDPAGINPQASIQYQATSGSVPRLVTLTGAQWPSWAANAFLRVQNGDGSYSYAMYRVAKVLSATTLTLDCEVCPATDIVAGTYFTLYQNIYELPSDLISQDQPFYQVNIGGMTYVQPREWMFTNQYILSEGTPQWYSVGGDPQYPGRLVMRIAPFPTEQNNIDFMYLRRPRPLVFQQVNGGLASIGANSTTVTLSQPIFVPSMEGSIIRLAANAKTPSGAIGSIAGYNPPSLEATITNYISPTAATVSLSSPSALTGVGYYVTDPIDFEQGQMLSAFLRMSEAKLANLRNLKNKGDIQAGALFALEEGKAAASVSYAGQCAGPRSRQRLRLRDMGPLIR
jgi:hypothetical protein